MSDILVFLQEKDQKYTFASLVSHSQSQPFISDQRPRPRLLLPPHIQYVNTSPPPVVLWQDKSPVVSLTNLIVRDIANQERGMYLISAATPPVMYELYASTKDDRRSWMTRIQKAALRSVLQTVDNTVVQCSTECSTECSSLCNNCVPVFQLSIQR